MGDHWRDDRGRTLDLRERKSVDPRELDGVDVVIVSTTASGVTRRKISRKRSTEALFERLAAQVGGAP